MPYDHYEYFKKQNEHEEYNEIIEIVRQEIWSDSIDFKIMLNWTNIEDKVRNRLFLFLRYN
ncbi:MAG: hypothetical protein IKF11_01420 [Methanobrevibacter sp.]|nr:hypothetical protein [Methanobrevibacter sp.]